MEGDGIIQKKGTFKSVRSQKKTNNTIQNNAI